MIGKTIEKLKNENGAAQILEASIVFPVMFIILFFLIYMGNVHYQKAQIEAVVTEAAIKGAGYCADPILQTIKEKNGIPTISSLKTEPYRYIFGGMNDIEKKIGSEVADTIQKSTLTFFSNMSPKLTTKASDIAKFNNYVIYSTFSVEVKYQIQFPIRFLGEKTPPMIQITSRAEMPVNDVAEFIRNTDMVLDVFHGTKLGQSISNLFGKINDFISSFAQK